MARIKIYENDLTSNAYNSEYTDIVFVPGFATVSTYAGKPITCYTEKEFISYFGTDIPKINCKDYEPDLDNKGAYQFIAWDDTCCMPIAYRPGLIDTEEKTYGEKEDEFYPVYAKLKNSVIKYYQDKEYKNEIEIDKEKLKYLKVKSCDGTEKVELVDTKIKAFLEAVNEQTPKLTQLDSGVWESELITVTVPDTKKNSTFECKISDHVNGKKYKYYQVVDANGAYISGFEYLHFSFSTVSANADEKSETIQFTKSIFNDQDELQYYYKYVNSNNSATGVFYAVKKYTVLDSYDEIDETAFEYKQIPKLVEQTITDTSYPYARELLYKGLPVLFWQIRENVTFANLTYFAHGDEVIEGPEFSDPQHSVYFGNADHFKASMHDFIVGDDIKLIMDRGEFDFKYLSTGGYPIFKVTEKDNTIKDVTTKITSESIEMISALLSIVQPRIEAAITLSDSTNEKYNPKYTDDNPGFKTGSTSQSYEDIDIIGRGDCILLVDHELKPDYKTLALRKDVQDLGKLFTPGVALEFAAMFTPWNKFVMTYEQSIKADIADKLDLPGSFAYLSSLGTAIKSTANWNSIAGVARGKVNDLYGSPLLNNTLTNTIANTCQADPDTAEAGVISINCITEIKPYGQVIWGNRTLQPADEYKHVTAMGFLNIRNMVSDIKKECYKVSRRFMFEQNSSVLWADFANKIRVYLDQLKSGYAISEYELRRGKNTSKHKLYAELRIKPIYAVEFIRIDIDVLNENVEISEGED